MPSAIVPPSRILQQPAHMAGLLWRRASALAVAAPGLAAHLQSSDERCTRRPSSFPCNLWPAWVAPTGGHRPLLCGGHKRGTKRSAEGQSVLPGGAFTRCVFFFCLQGLSSATWAQRWQTAQKRASGSLQVHLCPAILLHPPRVRTCACEVSMPRMCKNLTMPRWRGKGAIHSNASRGSKTK